MHCFFQISEAFFQKWTFINVHFQKIVNTFEKNDTLHSFSIRPPNIGGVPLCCESLSRWWSRANHYAVYMGIWVYAHMGR